jgi:ankyrin repeat protein
MRRCAALLTVLLLAGVVVVPVAATWREVRQEQLNRALIAAVDRNNVGAVHKWLHEGADPDALILPQDKRPWWRRFQDLLNHRPPPDLNNLESALSRAIAFTTDTPQTAIDNTEIVRALVEAGAHINRPVYYPVHYNVIFSVDQSSEAFVESVTPLQEAMEVRKREVALVLLAYGADVNASDKVSHPPLFEAAYYEDASLVEAFLQHGANIRARDEEGATIMLAALDQHLHYHPSIAQVRQTVQVLLRYGAPIKKKDTQNISLQALAHTFFHDRQLIQMLQQAGAE